jgi:hypothetical protein
MNYVRNPQSSRANFPKLSITCEVVADPDRNAAEIIFPSEFGNSTNATQYRDAQDISICYRIVIVEYANYFAGAHSKQGINHHFAVASCTPNYKSRFILRHFSEVRPGRA